MPSTHTIDLILEQPLAKLCCKCIHVHYMENSFNKDIPVILLNNDDYKDNKACNDHCNCTDQVFMV